MFFNTCFLTLVRRRRMGRHTILCQLLARLLINKSIRDKILLEGTFNIFELHTRIKYILWTPIPFKLNSKACTTTHWHSIQIKWAVKVTTSLQGVGLYRCHPTSFSVLTRITKVFDSIRISGYIIRLLFDVTIRTCTLLTRARAVIQHWVCEMGNGIALELAGTRWKDRKWVSGWTSTDRVH